MSRSGTVPLYLLLVIALFAQRMPAHAHGGEPELVVAAEPAGPYTVSVYADPDLGGGTFYIEVRTNETPPPHGTVVNLSATAATGGISLPPVEAQPEQGSVGRFTASIPFDREGAWTIKIALAGPQGSGSTAFTVRVEAPPPAWLAPLYIAVFLVGLGVFWVISSRKPTKRRS